MDSNIYNLLDKKGQEIGLPASVWYPIVMYESGGNPNSHAVTKKEDSRGLFQVNIFAHPDANSTQLFNPEYNANYQMPELKKTYDIGVSQGLSGVDLTKFVAKYGQRPTWTPELEQKITSYYSDFTGDKVSLNTGIPGINIPGIISDAILGPVTAPIKGVLNFAKLTFFDFAILLILLFALYVVFIKDTGIEDTGKKVVGKSKRAAMAIATEGASEAAGAGSKLEGGK